MVRVCAWGGWVAGGLSKTCMTETVPGSKTRRTIHGGGQVVHEGGGFTEAPHGPCPGTASSLGRHIAAGLLGAAARGLGGACKTTGYSSLQVRNGTRCLSPFLIGRMFVREPSWKYLANLVGS